MKGGGTGLNEKLGAIGKIGTELRGEIGRVARVRQSFAVKKGGKE
jgi:hypothetical protein